jgi:uncharacterized protein (DUF433 family)
MSNEESVHRPIPYIRWDDHNKRYSESRRKAPIYRLLPSSKKNHALWIFYHRLDKNILNEENDMHWHDRITVDPGVLVGKPVIKGTRVAMEFLLELLAEGWTHEQILKSYPQLCSDDIRAALHYATEASKQEHVYPLPV